MAVCCHVNLAPTGRCSDTQTTYTDKTDSLTSAHPPHTLRCPSTPALPASPISTTPHTTQPTNQPTNPTHAHTFITNYTHTASTARGFEPLRAEPNGFLVHHLSHSVTLSDDHARTDLFVSSRRTCNHDCANGWHFLPTCSFSPRGSRSNNSQT